MIYKNFIVVTIVIFIIFLFFLINKILNVQENYDTYFIPFKNTSTNLLTKFYENKDYNKNFFKHKMNYNEVYIYSSNDGYLFFNNFNKSLLSKSRIVKTNLYNSDGYKNNIQLLLNNKNSISNITLPVYLKKSSDKINLISNLNDIYLLCITKLKYNLYKISDISYNTKIGILNNENTIYFYYQKLLNELKINIPQKNIIIFNSQEKLFESLMKDEIQLIMYFTELPNKKLNKFIEYDFMNELIILPFELESEKSNLFFIRNDFSKIAYFDLNKITQSYLPKKFGDYYYFTYKPTIKLLSIKEYLICNSNINDSLVEDIFKFIFVYRKKYKNTAYQISIIEPSYDLIKYIPYHPKVLEIFRSFGYITNVDSSQCRYFVGKKECTEKVLQNYRLEFK